MLTPSSILADSPPLSARSSNGADDRMRRSSRRCAPYHADCQRPNQWLCWTLALSLTCLAVGLSGFLQPVSHPIALLEHSNASNADNQGELAMLELAAPELDAPFASNENMQHDMVLELPPAWIETAHETVELPDMPEQLIEADLVETPQPPPIEAMLTPAQPPAPRPAAPVARSSSSAPTTSVPRTPSASGLSSGSTGGAGVGTSGSSKSYFPSPPYPAAARSRGMQGTVFLSITFGADGRVTAASVARSSGYSELDRAASDWVRRNWRAASGQTGTFRQPVEFRLR